LGGFDLGRLNLAGWILSLLSLIVFFIITGVGASYLENNGIKQASKGQMKVFTIVGMGVAAAFFLLLKWILE
jgi:cation transport ATPase